ncbi:cell cycle checkpoint control protein RAD9A [Vigna radiata var. radiata]|uniref:Cell cycle checkpoint control protein RAD9A n=1 Tax=Vigna radiata var. radiata TaxID=3916 RepID=A0A1S3VFT7_VIGRR|nr:cell cycle checkpoint control protein RAD9A [Vigna radiata var. radiata]
MEFKLSDNALKTFARCITCLARIGNELAIQASSSQLLFHTINSSRSAYECITFKSGFFDAYTVDGNSVQCSVLLKAVCAVLRTPITNIDHLTVRLPDPDAPKLRWILDCYNGMRKTYWITCNVEPDIQHLSLDRQKFPSNFVVRPRDLNRLLANFQSSLQEITIIATEPSALPLHGANEIGGKAVELRSYMDPNKDNDTLLHTQLWIDPKEEFLQYVHTGDPIDVTFSVKELKAFLSFCEGCEVDIHLHFEKAGEPVLLAPKFGLEDGSHSNFDATLVLATMLTSQLHEGAVSEPPRGATRAHPHTEERNASYMQQENCRANASSELPSDHTRIWSDLSASAFKSISPLEERQAQGETVLNDDGGREIQRISTMQISRVTSVAGNNPVDSNLPTEKNHGPEPQDGLRDNVQAISQHHRSNWIDAEEDDEDEEEENEQCIQSTPPYYEEN